jgi:hypothetical protein
MPNCTTSPRAVLIEHCKDLIICPFHGELWSVHISKYMAANPAPCGCRWDWQGGQLVATPPSANMRPRSGWRRRRT